MIVMLFFLFGRPGTLGLLLRPVLWFLWIPRIHCYTETACRDEAHISHFWKTVKRFFWKNIKNIFDIVKKTIILIAFWIESSRIQSTTFPQRIPVLITSTIKAGFLLYESNEVSKGIPQGCYIGERNMTEIMATKQWLHLPLQNARTGMMKPCQPVARNRYTP